MRLVLQRAEVSDIDQIVHLAFDTFGPSDMMTVFFGTYGPAGLAHTKRHFLDRLQDPHDVFMCIKDLDSQVDVEVINNDTGQTEQSEKQARILCVGDWKVFPRYVAEKPMYGLVTTEGGQAIEGADLMYIEDESAKRDDAASILNIYYDRQRREQAEGHIYLYLLFTDRGFHGQGLGSMMMDWGNRLADSLMLPCWLEASEDGQKLYRNSGYVPREKTVIKNGSWTVDWLPMRRPGKQLLDGLVLK